MLVVCFAGSGRVDGRDFAECQDGGPPCLRGVCRGCVQGSLWADRGSSSGKGLVGPLALQCSPCPVPDCGPTRPLWEASVPASVPYSAATAEAVGKAWLLCWLRLSDKTPAACPPRSRAAWEGQRGALSAADQAQRVQGPAYFFSFSKGHGYR